MSLVDRTGHASQYWQDVKEVAIGELQAVGEFAIGVPVGMALLVAGSGDANIHRMLVANTQVALKEGYDKATHFSELSRREQGGICGLGYSHDCGPRSGPREND
jgi:hypothetical protein